MVKQDANHIESVDSIHEKSKNVNVYLEYLKIVIEAEANRNEKNHLLMDASEELTNLKMKIQTLQAQIPDYLSSKDEVELTEEAIRLAEELSKNHNIQLDTANGRVLSKQLTAEKEKCDSIGRQHLSKIQANTNENLQLLTSGQRTIQQWDDFAKHSVRKQIAN